jgi:hypothetical protein
MGPELRRIGHDCWLERQVIAFQMQTFVAIRNIESAIENGSNAAELKPLLTHAIDVALRWKTAS